MKKINLLLAVAMATLSAPAEAQERNSEAHAGAREDPWQGLNRSLYGFGSFLDHLAFRPLAKCYQHWIPRIVRHGVHNMLSNLDEPDIGVNDLLQGKPMKAGAAAFRFGVNTTVGVVGVFDVAARVGVAHHDNDAGLTLGDYHIGAGPYVYVPLAGPSSVRDLVGVGVDFVLDPLNIVNFNGSNILFNTQMAAGALDARVDADEDLVELDKVAADPYATERSIYLQTREAELHNQGVNVEAMPDIPDPQTSAPAPSPSPGANTARQ